MSFFREGSEGGSGVYLCGFVMTRAYRALDPIRLDRQLSAIIGRRRLNKSVVVPSGQPCSPKQTGKKTHGIFKTCTS